MPDQPVLDIAIYGGKSVEPRDPLTPGQPPVEQPYVAPQAVPASSVVNGSKLLAEGAANLRANAREKADGLEAVGAAATQWLPSHAYEYLKTPNFAADVDFSPAAFIQEVPFQLAQDDETFLMKAVSTADATHRLEVLARRNEAHVAMGDQPVLSFIGAALDPTYLAIDAASLGTARLLRAGRATAGVTAAGLTAGALTAEAQVTPVSTTEIVMGSMMMGAASATFFRRGRMEPVDPAFPSQPLLRLAEDMRAGVDEAAESAALRREVPLARVADEVQVASPASQELRLVANDVPKKTVGARVVLAEIAKGPDALLSVMARHVDNMLLDDVAVHTVAKKNLLDGKRAYYSPGEHAVYIAKDTPANMQLHEITHALTEHKLIYGMKNPTSAHGKIAGEIETLRKGAIKHYESLGGSAAEKSQTAYFLSSSSEFVAGVFSGKTAFMDVLRSMPVQGTTKTALGSMVGMVRRLLRMPASQENALIRTIGLTEALAAEPLKTTLTTNKKLGKAAAPGDYSVRGAPDITGSTKEIISTLSKAKDVAAAIEWSWHKTFSRYSPKSKEIADLLMDSPTNPGGNSAASIQRAVRADLAKHQYEFEGALLEAMGAKGAGLTQRIFNTGKAVKIQQGIERDVYAEMIRRNRAAKDGVSIDPHPDAGIRKMADALDALSARSLKELKAAGVKGSEDLLETSGYVTRRWDAAKMQSIERRLLDGGLQPEAARQRIVDSIAIGIQRANGWDAEIASDVAGTIFDRTKRRGMFQDAEFNTGSMGEDGATKLRSLLHAEGLSGVRLDRVMEVLAGKADEAGVLPTLKNRVDMHLDERMVLPDGSEVRLMDMLDTNVSAITERYLDTISARSALARKGMSNPSEINATRQALAASIDDIATRGEAVKSFDDMLDVLQGNPVGEEMLGAMRNIQAVTQMVGLAKSGLWQLTEYSTIMAQYGAVATMKSIAKEMPFIRSMVKHEAGNLRDVLSRNSSQDTRLRPFISRMEDNFEIPMSDSLKLSLMQAKQLVPYANAMKFIQKHQARTSANLIVDTVVRATKGDAKAIKALEEYGLESGSMVKVSDDISKYGMDTAKWSDSTWNEVRSPLTKMMDDAVLRARLGEIPKFAHTSTVGKFLFTFRSFTLAAHNKVLARTLNSGGYGGIGLLLAYQIPMTMLAVQAGNVLSGKDAGTLEENAKQTFSTVGSLGLFTEVFGIATGNKQQFGTPGLIAVDRMYRVAGAISDGDGSGTAAAALAAIPVMSAFLPTKALGEALKSDEE